MAENKLISELSGITNPSLTGYTVYDDGITTYRMALGELTAYTTAAEGDFTTTSSFNTHTSSVKNRLNSISKGVDSIIK